MIFVPGFIGISREALKRLGKSCILDKLVLVLPSSVIAATPLVLSILNTMLKFLISENMKRVQKIFAVVHPCVTLNFVGLSRVSLYSCS